MKKWLGSTPIRCDLCGERLKTKFVDGRTSMGPWAMMCIKCHGRQGGNLGCGLGQMYKKKGNNWIKIGG